MRGLAFFPKGYRLAVAHYNGASLWFPNTAAAPDVLDWKGSHLDATVSPDARFVVTSMQENALHGWRLADRKDMRMTGYPAKTRLASRGRMTAAGSPPPAPTAASSGPFPARTARWASRRANAACVPSVVTTAVAFHPRALVVAIGYDDGWILLVRLTDGAEILVRRTEADEPRRHFGAGLQRGRQSAGLRRQERPRRAARYPGLIRFPLDCFAIRGNGVFSDFLATMTEKSGANLRRTALPCSPSVAARARRPGMRVQSSVS